MNTQEQKELREAIGKEIDFMCDHWTEGDTKASYSFGGWRGEIIEDLAALFEKRLSQAIQTERESWRQDLERMLNIYSVNAPESSRAATFTPEQFMSVLSSKETNQ